MSGLLTRVAIAVAAALVATACAATATGFLIGALYFYLRQLLLTPALAALIVALVLLAIGALVVIAVRLFLRRRSAARRLSRRVAAGNGHDWAVEALAERIGAQAADGVASTAEAHPYYACSAAFLAGIVLGRSPGAISIVEAALRATDGSARPHS